MCTAGSDDPQCTVVLGTSPCQSPSWYVGLQCLLVSRPFYHAFIGATCEREGASAFSRPLSVHQCFLAQSAGPLTLNGMSA